MPKSPKRILIADDEEDLTLGISRSLAKDRGRYEVICVNSGDKALEKLAEGSVDLLVSDIRMPGRSGLDLLNEVRQKYPRTKVILMTAYGSPELHTKVQEAGSVHYIEKPFDMLCLRKLIHQTIGA